MRGVVKWYNAERGYGFIAVPGLPDLFARLTAQDARELRIKPGDEVDFNVVHSEKGLEAANVIRFSDPLSSASLADAEETASAFPTLKTLTAR